MNALLERVRAALQTMTPRERVMVITAAVVVLFAVLYFGIWQTLARAHAQRALALEQSRAIATRIEQAAAKARTAGGGRQVDRRTSLVAAVDQTSRSRTLGKAPSRVQPEGESEVKIWFEDVGFSNLLRWLQELETRYGIVPGSAELERGSEPGLVSARLSLVREQ